jgi:hypothetical protein
MNHSWTKKIKDRAWLVPLISVAICLVVITSNPPVAEAGDSEGISGYSVRLKNKDFDGSDSGSGPQSTLSVDLKVDEARVPLRDGYIGNPVFTVAVFLSRFFYVVSSR